MKYLLNENVCSMNMHTAMVIITMMSFNFKSCKINNEYYKIIL